MKFFLDFWFLVGFAFILQLLDGRQDPLTPAFHALRHAWQPLINYSCTTHLSPFRQILPTRVFNMGAPQHAHWTHDITPNLKEMTDFEKVSKHITLLEAPQNFNFFCGPGFDSREGQILSLFFGTHGIALGPLVLLWIAHQSLQRGWNQLHLVYTLRVCGAIPLFPHTPSVFEQHSQPFGLHGTAWLICEYHSAKRVTTSVVGAKHVVWGPELLRSSKWRLTEWRYGDCADSVFCVWKYSLVKFIILKNHKHAAYV